MISDAKPPTFWIKVTKGQSYVRFLPFWKNVKINGIESKFHPKTDCFSTCNSCTFAYS